MCGDIENKSLVKFLTLPLIRKLICSLYVVYNLIYKNNEIQ